MKKSSGILILFLIFVTGNAIAGKPAPPGAIVDYARIDGVGDPYSVRPSDGKGALINGVDCTGTTWNAVGDLSLSINQCNKSTPPQRTMEINISNPANGQNPIGDYTSLTVFHIIAPRIGSLTAVGQTLDIDLGLATAVGSTRNTTINYKIRYGEAGTPLAHVACTAAYSNQCTQWVITPGGSTDLAEVFDDTGVDYGEFHMPFYLTITRQ